MSGGALLEGGWGGDATGAIATAGLSPPPDYLKHKAGLGEGEEGGFLLIINISTRSDTHVTVPQHAGWND